MPDNNATTTKFFVVKVTSEDCFQCTLLAILTSFKKHLSSMCKAYISFLQDTYQPCVLSKHCAL